MASETERKRFHLERIIENISEETTSVRADVSGITLVTIGEIVDQEQDNALLEKGDFGDDSDGIKSVESESTSGEECGNDKDSSADDIVVPVKISPRCDVCGLLHFKSYRCVTRISAPTYIRQAFDDNYQKLRVCRKCLTSQENCVENVAISNLVRYSDKIRQMRIPLGMTSDRRTKPFEFVVRDLKLLKDVRRNESSRDPSSLELTCNIDAVSAEQAPRKTLLQRFQVDDPVQKNLFLKELNLYSTDFLKNIAENKEYGVLQRAHETASLEGQNNGAPPPSYSMEVDLSQSEGSGKTVYHVAAKNVLTTNAPERKIGESFGARKGVSHDLVMNTKRAWKPNKKYDDLRKVGNPNKKKEKKQPKPARKEPTAGDKADQAEKIRTCGITCAVCDNHVQKSYSCCTIQTAPEKYKHLFTPDVVRLKICRRCIPYKKVVKLGEPIVVKSLKKKLKVKKRGRKPKEVKPTTVVTALPRGAAMLNGDAKFSVKNELGIAGPQPFTSILNPGHHLLTEVQVVNTVESMDS